MKRRQILLAFAALISGPAAADQPVFRGVSPNEVLRGRFLQERQIKGFTRPLVSSGAFVLAPGRGLIWRTEQPFAIVTVITAAGLVQEVDGTETTHLAAAQLPFLGRLYDLLGGALAGDWRRLEALFQATQQGDARHWVLTLVPRSNADALTMPFRSIILRGGQFLDEVRIVRFNDDADRLVFSDETLSAGGPSDAEIARLRAAAR